MAEFDGQVNILDSASSSVKITLNGDSADISAGGNGQDGNIVINDDSGNEIVHLNGRIGHITINSSDGNRVIELNRNGQIKAGADGQGGFLLLDNNDGNNTIHIDADTCVVHIGGNERNGLIVLKDSNGDNIISLSASNGDISAGGHSQNGNLYLKNGDGNNTITLDGRTGDINAGGHGTNGSLILRNDSNQEVFNLDANDGDVVIGGNGVNGDVELRNRSNNNRIRLNAGGGNIWLGGNGADGDLVIFSRNGDNGDLEQATIHINGDDGSIKLKRLNTGTNTAEDRILLDTNNGNIWLGGNGADGDLVLKDSNGNDIIHLGADEKFIMRNPDGTNTMEIGRNGNIYAGGVDNDGDIVLRSGENPPRDRIFIGADRSNIWVGGNGQDGDIVIFPHNATNVGDGSDVNDATIHLDGDAGDIRLQGADCAENFCISDGETVDPGTVLVVCDDTKLSPCRESYDKKVAGVVSGGNGLNPGIILNKSIKNTKSVPIALSGQVYCKVDAQYSSIEVGDLLTTSQTIGYAMKANDRIEAFGAVIGKALRPLKDGKGLIPILASLQ